MAKSRPLSDRVEFAENPEPRCACVLLLDTSASMQGDRIEALNRGLVTLRHELARDALTARRVDIAIVTFNSNVSVVQDFVTIDKFKPPTLVANGRTHMAEGLERALDLVAARKRNYRQAGVAYYRPWVFMITDGTPEGETGAAVAKAAARVRAEEQARHVICFAVGVEDADMERLSQVVVQTPLELAGLDFQGLFVWLSASMQTVSRSQPGEEVALPLMGWIKSVPAFLRKHEHAIRAGTVLAEVLVKFAGVVV